MQKLVVSHLQGGLGNQLFMYAAGRAMAHRNGAQLHLNISAFDRDRVYKRTFALSDFSVSVPIVSTPTGPVFIERLLQKIWRLSRRFPTRIGSYWGEHDAYVCDSEIINYDMRDNETVHLFGFRQEESYFADIRDILKRELKLKGEIPASVRSIGREIAQENSVAIHLRSYVDVKNGEKGGRGNVKTVGSEYYDRAISKIRDLVKDPKFFVFSDSLDATRNLLPSGLDFSFISEREGVGRDIFEFWLMSRARHFVIANSTFSWWAAWLGQREGTEVICPNTDGFLFKIVPARGWITIETFADVGFDFQWSSANEIWG